MRLPYDRILFWIVLLAALLTAFVLYRSFSSRSHLDVAPGAQREIERATRR